MKRIVIIGVGFAGLAAAKPFGRANADIVVIDRSNHNLFQPLLYQVATTVLSPAQIEPPVDHDETTLPCVLNFSRGQAPMMHEVQSFILPAD